MSDDGLDRDIAQAADDDGLLWAESVEPFIVWVPELGRYVWANLA